MDLVDGLRSSADTGVVVWVFESLSTRLYDPSRHKIGIGGTDWPSRVLREGITRLTRELPLETVSERIIELSAEVGAELLPTKSFAVRWVGQISAIRCDVVDLVLKSGLWVCVHAELRHSVSWFSYRFPPALPGRKVGSRRCFVP